MKERMTNSGNQKVMVLIAVATFIVVLISLSYKRLYDFQDHQYQIAHIATSNAAENISAFIVERQRLVKLFADHNIDLLDKLANNSENESVRMQLLRNLRSFFPNYFTFTLANPAGEPYFEDFEGLVMESCREDINTFSLEENYSPYIHPHPDGYHFDIMVRYGEEDNGGILFVSFKAEYLGGILRSLQPKDQQLMLVYPEKDDLIEVVTEGTRIKLQRDDYRLKPEENSRILVRAHIDNTRWQAVILAHPELFLSYKLYLLLESLIIFLCVILIATFFIYYNKNKLSLNISEPNTRTKTVS